jgi:hypothetical protein
MSASPEFYKPAAPVFSPLLLHPGAGGGVGVVGAEEVAAATVWEEEFQRCLTPTSGESQVKSPATCPPAPRKPRAPAPCRKRLFDVEVFSLRLEELERLFWRPHPAPPAEKKKRRRRVACPETTKKKGKQCSSSSSSSTP